MWLAVLDGRAPGGPAEIAVASRTMDQLGLEVGDTTTVSGACGERDGDGRRPRHRPGDLERRPRPWLGRHWRPVRRAVRRRTDRRDRPRLRGADPVARSGRCRCGARRAVPGRRRSRSCPGCPSSVTALAEIGQVPPLVATLVAIIGVAAATNALVLTVRRRGGDIAVLRALGLRPRDVRRAVGWQAATMADHRCDRRRSRWGRSRSVRVDRHCPTGQRADPRRRRTGHLVARARGACWRCSSPSPSGQGAGRHGRASRSSAERMTMNPRTRLQLVVKTG